MDLQSGVGEARFFFDLSKIRLEMARIGDEGSACQLQCVILVVQPCTIHSAPSRSLTLGRTVVSSSHCQPMGP